MKIRMETFSQASLPEDTLLAQQACKSVDAFAELYRRHVKRVYRYHFVHTGNVEDAEDLTSQTFMAALEGIRSFRGSGSFAAWIMGIAAHKRALFFRRQAKEVPLEENLVLPAQGQPVDKAVSQKLHEEDILRALRQISPERAEALVLCIFGELSAGEAGRVLGKSEAAVRMLVSRGLNDIRTRTTLTWETDHE